MTQSHTEALALAVARAAKQGDRKALMRLLSAAHAESAAHTDTFADAPKKGGWGMDFVNWLTGKKDAEAKHRSEHERQIAGFQPDDVQEAQQLTETERLVYSGELIHLISSNLYSIRYDRGDTRGGNTRTIVTFRNGSVYEIYDVPFSVVMQEVDSDSPGRAYWRLFREGTRPFATKYRYRKIGTLALTRAERKTPVVHVIRMGKKKP